MQQWERRVRAEVPAARDQDQTILHNSLAQMLEVMAKVLADQTDPLTRGLGGGLAAGREGPLASRSGVELQSG